MVYLLNRVGAIILSGPSPSPSSSPGAGGADKCSKTTRVSIDFTDGATAPGLSTMQHVINMVAVTAIWAGLLCAVAGLLWIPLGRTVGVRDAGTHGRLMMLGGVGVAFLVPLIAVVVNIAFFSGSQTTCTPS